jgi:hypothetical protein
MIANFHSPYSVILSTMLLPGCSNKIPIVSQSVSECAIQKSFQKIRINATTMLEYSPNVTLVVTAVYRASD